jgi:signal transduction histidine kinase
LFKVTATEGQPIPPEERPLNLVLKGRPVSNFQMRFIDLKGQEHEVLVNAAAVDTPAGKRAFAIMRDVTDIRILERSRQEFMQVVSHEMRNPLQVIKGLVQLIEMRLANEGGQAVGRHLKALGNQITFLTALVDDILTAYRLGTGKMTIRAQEVPLLHVVSEAVAPYLNDQIHSLHTSYTVPETLLVKADPQRVAQIVSNLLSNATKYTPEGKQIWVKTSMVGDSAAAVRVEDEGIGIPSDQLEKVFEGFVRAHNVTEWMSGGIGLGLYISRNLARRMGGDLWAEQRPGGGTIMTLTLPLGESGQKRYPTILSGCV